MPAIRCDVRGCREAWTANTGGESDVASGDILFEEAGRCVSLIDTSEDDSFSGDGTNDEVRAGMILVCIGNGKIKSSE